MKGIRNTTGMLMAESVGYGIGGRMAGDVDAAVGNHVATNAFSNGASLAGIPSLVSGSSNVLGSLKLLNQGKHRKKRR
jgi:hypothetical protein